MTRRPPRAPTRSGTCPSSRLASLGAATRSRRARCCHPATPRRHRARSPAAAAPRPVPAAVRPDLTHGERRHARVPGSRRLRRRGQLPRRSRSPGVATSTTGLRRPAPTTARCSTRAARPPIEPRLVTSYAEFERVYGGLEPLRRRRLPYLAHAARAFFLNGGRRLYVSRVYVGPRPACAGRPPVDRRGSPPWRTCAPAGPAAPARSRSASPRCAAATSACTRRTRRPRGPGGPARDDPRGRAARRPGSPRPDDAARPGRACGSCRSKRRTQTFFDDADGNSRRPAVTDLLLPVEVTVTRHREPATASTSTRGWASAPAHRRAIERVLGRDDPQDEDAWSGSTTTPARAAPARSPC